MTDPILALRVAIHARLSGDAALITLLGGAHIYDEAPRALSGLYVTFGEARARDWSTGGDRGHEHDVALVVWSKPGGGKPALEVAARIAALLDDVSLTPNGHRLVTMRVIAEEARRDDKANLTRVTLRLRAVTEVTSAL